MAGPIYIYGAGGHARVIVEMCEDLDLEIRRIYVDHPQGEAFLGYPVNSWNADGALGLGGIIAIGDNTGRCKVALKVGGTFARVFHPNAFISRRANISEGCVAMSGTTIHGGTSIGHHCIVNTHASVDHDCFLGDFVHIAPHAALCGHVSVGTGTLVGAGSVIIPGVTIGSWVTIGAGAVIRKDVPDGALVVGNPGRIIKIDKSISYGLQ
jgi:sugar O-acyltransferase (sialic acid O-acetyltransferase NeuD family)